MKEERCAPNSSSGSTQLRSAPLGFEYTGDYRYLYGSPDGVGSRGYYWSRSADSANYAYYLYFYSSSVDPQDNSSRGLGMAIRCDGK